MNRFSLRLTLLGVLCGLAAVTSSRATTITFDSIASSGNPHPLSVPTQGFIFSSDYFNTIDTPGSIGSGAVSDGTIYIAEFGGTVGQPIAMTLSGGGSFSLTSVFGSKLFITPPSDFPNAVSLNIVGNLSGGGTVSTTFTLDSSFKQFVLPSTFTGLSSVVFSGNLAVGAGGAIALDTIVANSASVPDGESTVLLLAVTLIALELARAKLTQPKPVLKRIHNRR